MKIWIDILTPKQVLFFNGVGEELIKRDHQISITLRFYRETVGLAEKYLYNKFNVDTIGEYGGGTLKGKLVASLKRSMKLTNYVNKVDPDVAISFTSPDAARVAYGLGIPHISVSDTPEAEAAAKLSIPLSRKLYCPWVIPKEIWVKYGISEDRIIHYKGLDPVVWIKRHREDTELISRYNLKNRKYIVIRTVEEKASYQLPLLSREKYDMKKWINEFQKISNYEYDIFILPRYEDQVKKIKQEYKNKESIFVMDDVIDGLTLIKYSDGFVGYGGTMTMESALLGKPTISLRPTPPKCHEYLINEKLIKQVENKGKIAETLLNLIEHKNELKNKAVDIYSNMQDPAEVIAETIEEKISI